MDLKKALEVINSAQDYNVGGGYIMGKSTLYIIRSPR